MKSEKREGGKGEIWIKEMAAEKFSPRNLSSLLLLGYEEHRWSSPDDSRKRMGARITKSKKEIGKNTEEREENEKVHEHGTPRRRRDADKRHTKKQAIDGLIGRWTDGRPEKSEMHRARGLSKQKTGVENLSRGVVQGTYAIVDYLLHYFFAPASTTSRLALHVSFCLYILRLH